MVEEKGISGFPILKGSGARTDPAVFPLREATHPADRKRALLPRRPSA